MKVISENETLIEGMWVVTDDQISSNEACKRIEWLITDIFKLIRVDVSGWEKLYQDPKDQRFWLLYYPQGEMHGGGPPSLMEMTYKDAELRFNAKNTYT
ncbi:MAG TPA: hypothetical protein ENI65_08140 [Gammaproteobacteria bacterium]|nr:hypothetical protein [Gammaproteobacteria bacterium]